LIKSLHHTPAKSADQNFIRTDNETLPVAAMSVSNPDCSSF